MAYAQVFGFGGGHASVRAAAFPQSVRNLPDRPSFLPPLRLLVQPELFFVVRR
jgi:hypothetical protein